MLLMRSWTVRLSLCDSARVEAAVRAESVLPER